MKAKIHETPAGAYIYPPHSGKCVGPLATLCDAKRACLLNGWTYEIRSDASLRAKLCRAFPLVLVLILMAPDAEAATVYYERNSCSFETLTSYIASAEEPLGWMSASGQSMADKWGSGGFVAYRLSGYDDVGIGSYVLFTDEDGTIVCHEIIGGEHGSWIARGSNNRVADSTRVKPENYLAEVVAVFPDRIHRRVVAQTLTKR